MIPKHLTVIAPVYNEAEVIGTFCEELKRHLAELRPAYESDILLVLDRCNDDTLTVVRGLAAADPSIKSLVLSSRFGHQMSLLAGLDHARADIYVMMDSDLQHPPTLIKEMIRLYESGCDVVHTIRKDTERQSLWRRTAGQIFYAVLTRISDAPIQVNAADFRLFTDRIAKLFRTQLRERKMFMRGLISWVGFNQRGLEYIAAPRRAGRSKYSLMKMAVLAGDAMVSFSTVPLKISLILGSVMSLAGFVYAVITVIQYGTSSRLPTGWATLVILVTIFAGVQLLCLGLVGAYVGAIYAEVKNRPHYIVDETINLPTAS